MTRKHFEATAAIVRNISNDETRRTVAQDFAFLFAGENPRFRRQQFLAACNVSERVSA